MSASRWKHRERTLRPIVAAHPDLRGLARPCAGCGEAFVPTVAETICPGCAQAIAVDPDPWLAVLAHRRVPG